MKTTTNIKESKSSKKKYKIWKKKNNKLKENNNVKVKMTEWLLENKNKDANYITKITLNKGEQKKPKNNY